jgi:putative inorganic carbon (hco3(-)) transporter
MARAETIVSLRRRPFVFGAIVVFSGLYYYRPEDFIQPLSYIPMAKVVGILAFVALLIGIMGGGKVRVPRAIKILWALLFHMSLCIPFALWRTGAFNTVFEKFSKGVIVAMLISMTVVTLGELRKLVWIQLSAVTLVTALSIMLHHYNRDGRLEGIQSSILSNPNDLAINIAITFPMGLAFMLGSRGFKKAVWAAGLAFMGLGVVLTSSRSGLLALTISIIFCVWEYGIKGKRRQLVVATILVFVMGLGIAVSSSHYRARIESIFLGNVEGSGDKGSREARAALLKKSAMVALTHPLFGVGPGCFVLVDSGWVVAHNAYTEIAAEAGIPALVLFLMAIWAAFKNIASVRKSQQYREDPELRLLTQAVGVGLVAYVVGSFFGSTEYNLYPYFMISYTCALVKIVSAPALQDGRDKHPSLRNTGYAIGRKAQFFRGNETALAGESGRGSRGRSRFARPASGV